MLVVAGALAAAELEAAVLAGAELLDEVELPQAARASATRTADRSVVVRVRIAGTVAWSRRL